MAFTYTGTQVDLGFGRGWLNGPAAASIRRIDRQIGHPLQTTETGRTRAQQMAHYQHFLRYGSPIALSPDAPSLHQKGNAVDTNEGQRIHAVMEDHGWRRTVYRFVNGKWTLVEPWHYEYFPQYDNHIHESSGGSNTEEDDMDSGEFRAYMEEFKGWAREMTKQERDSPSGRLEQIHRRVDETFTHAETAAVRIRGFDPNADMLQLILGKLGVPIEAQIDTARLARELAPLLDSAIDEMTDEEVERISKRVNDVRDQRERDRLAS